MLTLTPDSVAITVLAFFTGAFFMLWLIKKIDRHIASRADKANDKKTRSWPSKETGLPARRFEDRTGGSP